MTRPTPVLKELSGRSADAAWSRFFDSSIMPSHILRSEGFGGGGLQGLFDLYDEMEEKDGHLFATLQTRKSGVLSCPRKVIPASGTRRDLEVARFIEKTIARIPGFDQALMNILDAVGKGVSIQEILWEARAGEVGVRAIRSRAPGRFLFGPDGALHIPTAAAGAAIRSAQSVRLPERKFIRFTFGGLYDNPYGRGLCARAYWYYWFKKNNMKFWVIYNEKFGAPTVVGKYGPGSSEEDRSRLFEVVESLQNDTGVTVPESMTLELLEARRSGNATTYRELAEWCNDEISKIVLGATLTAGEGHRSGSLALGKVHERIRSEYVETDARALENAINSQFVRWLVDFNYGPDAEAPHWSIDTTRDDALEREVAIDRELVSVGIALPERYFYEKYKRPAPIASEPSLRFDDRNLFQYHLRFGVLTINEARERLGLPPVPWGDARASEALTPRQNPSPDLSDPEGAEDAEERESDHAGEADPIER